MLGMNFEVQLALKVVFRPGFIVREATLKREQGFLERKIISTDIVLLEIQKYYFILVGEKKGKENNSLSLSLALQKALFSFSVLSHSLNASNLKKGRNVS